MPSTLSDLWDKVKEAIDAVLEAGPRPERDPVPIPIERDPRRR